MTIKQLRELELFYSIEPFGEFHHELRHGQSLALTANLNRDEKKHPAGFKPTDFMNFHEPVAEKIYTDEELENYADKIFRESTD